MAKDFDTLEDSNRSANAAAGLQPARVRSSPWCRCLDTATLAFGQAEPWAPLGSPHGTAETTNAESLDALRRAVAAAPPQRFEAWVTHQFVLSRLVGGSSSFGEGPVLRADAAGAHADPGVTVRGMASAGSEWVPGP